MRFQAHGLEFRYPGAAEPTLRGVDLDTPDGSLYAVLGPNGSGKSTLLRALLGVLEPTGGSVHFDGRPLREWSRRDLARAVGVVPQREVVSFPLSVRELVAMGRYPHLGALGAETRGDTDAVDRALEQCDVTGLADRDVGTLSGGEFQRVRIARALAQEPRALVLDEPTASLDIRHEMTILELLRAWADEGMTVLVVTHGVEQAARFADRMLLLSRGRVAAEGPPAQVLEESILREVYGWPLSVTEDPATGSLKVTPLRR
ncbi:MAG: ABC transporter ATP-binding protein [Gemmatimonadota bacterium]|nr:ABC transporter ATP-binding protein [Gemmatimonadota bacterium]MDH5759434.1 ABC transporter ATP-binding protein [Gemmatimonadota bacterium]